jgi:GNAT superfamily N-acetyltransferase
MIGFASWEMRPELSRIWQVCFQEPARPAEFFLNNLFSPRDCLVYRVGETVAAAVYLLPARVASAKGPLQAHYIYAAATLPRYRGRGYMASLLACAAMEGAGRGDRYSVVLPADAGLYGLYGKSGYASFFRVRNLSVPADRLRALAREEYPGKMLPDFRRLASARDSLAGRSVGSVLWSERMLWFAAGMGSVYGDRLVCSRAGDAFAYALCRPSDGFCAVLETAAEEAAFAGLASALLRESPAPEYRFRLPANGLFPGEGELSDFGMIKPVGGAGLDEIRSDAPYLGLTLD